VWQWCVQPLQWVGVSYYGFRDFKRELKILFGNIVCSSFWVVLVDVLGIDMESLICVEVCPFAFVL
jgi:hypothetical protein